MYWNYTIFAAGDIDEIAPFLEGRNEKKVLVAFLDENNAEHEALVAKILAAVQLDLERDCLCLRLPQGNTQPLPSLPHLSRKYTTNTALIFGISPKAFGLNMSIPPYQALEINGLKLCFSERLSVISENMAAKKVLWQALKTLF